VLFRIALFFAEEGNILPKEGNNPLWKINKKNTGMT
jgi:hypothetical protein